MNFKVKVMLKQKGFTLIELMVVVAIIGVLAALSFPSYESYMIKTNRNANCKTPLLEIAVLMEEHRGIHQTYPAVGGITKGSIQTKNSIPYEVSKENYTFNISAGPSGIASSYILECTVDTVKSADDCGSLNYDNFGRKKALNKSAGKTDAACWR